MKMFGYFDEEKNKTIESLEALSHVVAENVGGLKIDEEIAHYLADEFNKKHNVWIFNYQRSTPEKICVALPNYL